MGEPTCARSADAGTANVLFMVRVACDVCGHTLLFDCESFLGGNVTTLEAG